MRSSFFAWALCCALSLHSAARAGEVIVYTNDYRPFRGELKPPSSGQLTITSSSGPIRIEAGKVLAILPPDENGSFSTLLQGTNFKALNRLNGFRSAALPERLETPQWQALAKLFEGKDDRTFLVLGYKLLRNGRLDNLAVYHGSGDQTLDDAVAQWLSAVRFDALRSDYTGAWIPGYAILSRPLIAQARYLAELEEKMHADGLSPASGADCSYRIRLIYDAAGNPVHQQILGNRQTGRQVKPCQISAQNTVPAYFTKPVPVPSAFLAHDQELFGLSAWVDQRDIRLGFDPDFVTETLDAAIHEYSLARVEPAFGKLFRKIRKQGKVKFDRRSTRHARYLVTLSPASWPGLKAVRMTTPSGDKAFDEICTKTLTELKLPALPELLKHTEQETVFKCELWGDD